MSSGLQAVQEAVNTIRAAVPQLDEAQLACLAARLSEVVSQYPTHHTAGGATVRPADVHRVGSLSRPVDSYLEQGKSYAELRDDWAFREQRGRELRKLIEESAEAKKRERGEEKGGEERMEKAAMEKAWMDATVSAANDDMGALRARLEALWLRNTTQGQAEGEECVESKETWTDIER